jgi:hypothetical protein
MKTNQLAEFRDEGPSNVAVNKPGSQMLSRADIVGISRHIRSKVKYNSNKVVGWLKSITCSFGMQS